MGGDLHVHTELSFGVKLREFPSEDELRSGSKPLSLLVSGMEARPLPECDRMRRKLLVLLGEDNYNRHTVFRWWEEHMYEFQPEHSKIRRIYESFLGSTTVPMPRIYKEKGMWGYINAVPEVYEAFEFQKDSRAPGGMTITSRLKPPATEADERGTRRLSEFCQEVLRQERATALRFAASSINYLAMLHGHSAGVHGGCPRKVTKLFSAAHTWGPGVDSWQRYDDTWLCVDKKDMIGRTVSEQGRLIWQAPNGSRGQMHIVVEGTGKNKVKQIKISYMLVGGILLAFTVKNILPEQIVLGIA